MLHKEVIEHCCPDFVTPQHLKLAIGQSGAERPYKNLLDITQLAHVLYSRESQKQSLSYSYLCEWMFQAI